MKQTFYNLVLKAEETGNRSSYRVIEVSKDVFRKLVPDLGSTQVSVYIEDYAYMNEVLAKIEKLGYEVIREISGGGSDANIFNTGGKTCVNFSIGYDKIHTTEELVVIDEMEKAVNLVIELLQQAPAKADSGDE